MRSGSGDRPVAESPDLWLPGLLAIAERGCELQDRAQAVLRGCARLDHPDLSLAREGGHVAREYHRLYGWAVEADGGAGTDALCRHIALLLMQHCMTVHYAVRMAFPNADHGTRSRRPISPELGDTADRLRAGRDELAWRVEHLR